MTPNITYPRLYMRLFLGLAVIGGLLFWPAGTLNWPEAWIFLGSYVVWVIPLMIWLKKNNPDLLRQRMDWLHQSPKKWDRIIMLFMTFTCIPIVLIPGFDVIRYGWSHLPLWVEIAGFLMIIPALYIIFRVMQVNTFLSRVVEIQKEKRHHVISSGPYRYVRHPMYAGAIIYLTAIPLALGSMYALIPAILSAVLLTVRTALEDKTLQRELPGYKEYAKKTRYRLIPGIW